MSGMNFQDLSAEERLIAEQAVMNLQSLNKACREAEHGTALAVAETLVMEQGRESIRRTLESALNQQREDLEKKLP